jgi:monoamine oxidase
VSRGQPGTSGILNGFSGGSAAAELARLQSDPYTIAADPRTYWLGGRFLSELEPVFPGISLRANGRALLSLPFLDPNFCLSYSYPGVGQYHTLIGAVGLPQGSIHFAGEHTDEEFQGFMEGGARSGLRAANEILAALALPG